MILDGYSEFGEINGELFMYRPLKRHDRWALSAELERLPLKLAERLERQVVERQIVICEWGFPIRDFDRELYDQLWPLVLGVGRREQEIADETNLHRGVYLLTRWPHMAHRTCEHCRQWLWNPLSGEETRQTPDGPVLSRRGPTLCERPSRDHWPLSETACPRGHWSQPTVLSPKNQAAFRHYQTCEATGFPDDSIVRRNAKLIRHAQRVARADQAADGGPGGRGPAAGQLLHAARPRRDAGAARRVR